MKRLILLIAVILAACGGDGDGAALTIPNATHGGQVVPLRACETTGPDAPPCPASATSAAPR